MLERCGTDLELCDSLSLCSCSRQIVCSHSATFCCSLPSRRSARGACRLRSVSPPPVNSTLPPPPPTPTPTPERSLRRHSGEGLRPASSPREPPLCSKYLYNITKQCNKLKNPTILSATQKMSKRGLTEDFLGSE